MPAFSPEGRDELVVHDLHDLLTRVEAAQQIDAQGPLADAGDELLHDAEVDVGLEQRKADLTQRDVEIRLGDLGLPAQAVNHALKPGTQRFEHWLAR